MRKRCQIALALLPILTFSAALASAATTEPSTALSAWSAVPQMTPGINIGNTFENTVHWETGWGSPLITRDYIHALARLGFKTVRLPVAWDTYATDGRIQPDKFQRIDQIVDWITAEHMFCVLNIHWDGGWIDSDDQKKFPATFHSFSPEAEKKFRSYWQQIATHFAANDGHLLFESLNEESNFDNAGSPQKALDTLSRVNQLFIDTVRRAGGNNPTRLLIIAGYTTDIAKTCTPNFHLPHDTIPDKLLLSLHYYTPWPFVGMNEDASWGKMAKTWGSPDDLKQLNQLFDTLNAFCTRNNTPAFIGEFAVCSNKEQPSTVRWMSAVANAAIKRKMVPVLWDTGSAVSRRDPYAASPVLQQMLHNLTPAPTPPPPTFRP